MIRCVQKGSQVTQGISNMINNKNLATFYSEKKKAFTKVYL